jgi:hypothetical protein
MSGKKHHIVLVVAIVLGVALRIWAGLAPGSLWFDELATGLNVRGHAWGAILEPLGYRQVMPLGFLAGEMAGVAVLGEGELGLRLFPLLASIAALLLFWRLAARFLDGAPLAGAVAFFAVNPALVWYARKAKQYASDVTVTLVLLLLAIRWHEGPRTARRAWIAGALGGVALLFSQPGVFVAAGLLVVLCVQSVRDRSPLRPLVPIGLLWGLGCLVQTVTSLELTPPATHRFMSNAWQFAFFPPPWESWSAFTWLPLTMFDFVGFIVAFMEPDSAWEVGFLAAYAFFMVVGAVSLARSRSTHALLLLTPLAVAILASALRVIPLNGRLMIYVGPPLLVAAFVGVRTVSQRIGPRVAAAIAVALVAAPAAFLPFVLSTLSRHEDSKAVLLQLRERWREGDALYVYSGAEQAMRFYGEPLGLGPWIAGQETRPDARTLLREVDALRGHPRAWFFYAHGVGCKPALIRSYLESIGAEIDRIEDPHGTRGMHETAASLYDLSDPVRLARSSAARQPPLDRSDPRCASGERVGERIRARLRALVSSG